MSQCTEYLTNLLQSGGEDRGCRAEKPQAAQTGNAVRIQRSYEQVSSSLSENFCSNLIIKLLLGCPDISSIMQIRLERKEKKEILKTLKKKTIPERINLNNILGTRMRRKVIQIPGLPQIKTMKSGLSRNIFSVENNKPSILLAQCSFAFITELPPVAFNHRNF